jgi:hypothetical protein
MALSFVPVAHQCFTLALRLSGTALAGGSAGKTALAAFAAVWDIAGSTIVMVVGPRRASKGSRRRRGRSVVEEGGW